jgi:hypothetical protein
VKVMASFNLCSSIDIATSCSKCPAAMWCMTTGLFSVVWKTCHFCHIKWKVVVVKHTKPRDGFIRQIPLQKGHWPRYNLEDYTRLKQAIVETSIHEKFHRTIMLELPAGEVPCSCSVPYVMWSSYVCPTCTAKIDKDFTVFDCLNIERKKVGYIETSQGSELL